MAITSVTLSLIKFWDPRKRPNTSLGLRDALLLIWGCYFAKACHAGMTLNSFITSTTLKHMFKKIFRCSNKNKVRCQSKIKTTLDLTLTKWQASLQQVDSKLPRVLTKLTFIMELSASSPIRQADYSLRFDLRPLRHIGWNKHHRANKLANERWPPGICALFRINLLLCWIYTR